MRLRSAALAAAGLVAALYLPLLRRPILTWGATAEEAAARLPGDELLEDADGVSTRAITIDAPAAAVWPWLAQMGPSPRGGAYTYDWIENLLGLDMHSVDRVLPEFQHPEVGDTIGFGTNRMRLERVEPEHVLAWRSEDGNWVWTFVLDEQRRPDAADQPQPLPPPDAGRARSACCRWSRPRSSWSGRCCAGSRSAPSGSHRARRRTASWPPAARRRISSRLGFDAVMRRYHVTTFGCQMNAHDSERIKGLLEELGLGEAPTADEADVVVFNTCTIREKPDTKLAAYLGDARRAQARRSRPRDRGRRLLRRGSARADLRALPGGGRRVRPGSIAHLGDWLGAGGVGVARGRFGLDDRAFAASCRCTASAASRPGCRCRWAATRSARTASSRPCAGASRAAARARSSPR